MVCVTVVIVVVRLNVNAFGYYTIIIIIISAVGVITLPKCIIKCVCVGVYTNYVTGMHISCVVFAYICANVCRFIYEFVKFIHV